MTKSVIIKVRSENSKVAGSIRLISLYGFGISSPSELTLIQVLHTLYHSNTFMLNEAVRSQIKGKIPAISDAGLKMGVSRLIKAGILIKQGKLLGLHVAFKDVSEIDQVVLRIT